MKVLYFATYYTSHYVRQDVIRDCLKKNKDIKLIECVYNSKSFFRYLIATWKFLLLPKRDVDIIIVGFRGQEILPFIRLMTRKPIIFDAFISIYDTLCFERRKFEPQSLIGRFTYWLDRYDCKIADRVILDTNAHIEYFSKTFHIPKEKFSRIFVGADQSIFYPREVMKKEDKFTIFYYGTGLPLQGIEIILNAAKILESDSMVLFRLAGPIRRKYKESIDSLNLKNVEYINWVPYEELPKEIAKADVCLGGHFSSVEKARRVISGKTFQFLAMKKSIIVGENKANGELLKHKKNCIMVEMANPKTLANAILELKFDHNLREKIAEAGYQTFLATKSEITIGLFNAVKGCLDNQ